VIDPETKEPVLGEYTAGWIKRGPSGVIGTNKPDAVETVENMMVDLANGRILNPAHPTAEAALDMITAKQPRYVSYADWQKLDEIEVQRGKEQGRPRVKFVDVEEMLAVLGK
jgi:ferredoxin--NADP+ reductase